MSDQRNVDIREALQLLEVLKETLSYLKTVQGNEIYLKKTSEMEIEKAKDHLYNLLEKGSFDKSKLETALAHIKKIEELLGHINELIKGKNKKVYDEINTIYEQVKIIENFISLLEKAKSDLDNNANELNSAVKDIEDISIYLHKLDEIDTILKRENEDLVKETQGVIEQISQIKQEVTALKHIEDNLKKAKNNLILAGHAPNQEIEDIIQELIKEIDELDQKVKASSIAQMQDTRREYYRLLSEFKKEREKNQELKRQFDILKRNINIFVTNDNNFNKGSSKNKLMGQTEDRKTIKNKSFTVERKGALEKMIKLCKEELDAMNSMFNELNNIKDIVNTAQVVFLQEEWNLVEKIKKGIDYLLKQIES